MPTMSHGSDESPAVQMMSTPSRSPWAGIPRVPSMPRRATSVAPLQVDAQQPRTVGHRPAGRRRIVEGPQRAGRVEVVIERGAHRR